MAAEFTFRVGDGSYHCMVVAEEQENTPTVLVTYKVTHKVRDKRSELAVTFRVDTRTKTVTMSMPDIPDDVQKFLIFLLYEGADILAGQLWPCLRHFKDPRKFIKCLEGQAYGVPAIGVAVLKCLNPPGA
jgi:hypothetical protein